MATVELQIDDTLRTILQPLEDDEFSLLEKSILEEGCRESLVAWKGTELPTLLDGHNRKKICEKHGITYDVELIDLPDWQAARNWVIRCQLARRNIAPEQASYLRGLRYNAEKGTHGGDRKSNPQNGDLIGPVDVALAKEYGVERKTIQRDGKFTGGIDAIHENVKLPDHRLFLGREKKLKRNETIKLSKWLFGKIFRKMRS